MKAVLSALALAGSLTSTLAHSSAEMKQNVRANFGDHRMVTLESEHLDAKVHDILSKHSYDQIGHDKGTLHLRLTPEAVKALQKEGVPMQDKTEDFLSNMERNLNAEGFFCEDSHENCARRTADDFYSSYHTLTAMYTRVSDLAANYPELASMGSIGKSYEGRDMPIIFIGDQTKPIVWYQCNVHAREWLTPMFCVYMAETLVGEGAGHPLLEKFGFIILASVNPDGYEYSFTVNNAWRKTRAPNPWQPSPQCDGVDANRNYAVGWGGPGASSDPCTETYHGHQPFQSVELINIRDFTTTIGDKILSINDVHSYGNYWMSPWAGTYDLPPEVDWDRMETCNEAAAKAIEAVNGLVFSYGSVANTIYIAAGGAVDWFYDELGVIYSYTLEARSAGLGGIAGFQPPPVNIMPSNLELFEGMRASIECAFELEFGAPTSFPTMSPFECVDLDPNGITYADGTPAPCEELGAYCEVYDFVTQRCPATCAAQCTGAFVDVVRDVRVVDEAKLKVRSSAATSVVVGAAVGAVGLVAAVVAAVVVYRRKQQGEGENKEEVVSADI